MGQSSSEYHRLYQAKRRAKLKASPDTAAAFYAEEKRLRDNFLVVRGPVYTLLRSAKMRAKRDGVPFDLQEADVVIPTHCPIFGMPLIHGRGRGKATDNSPSLDRIIPALGYVKGNVAVISFRANSMKRDGSADELVRLAIWIKHNTPVGVGEIS